MVNNERCLTIMFAVAIVFAILIAGAVVVNELIKWMHV
jgi:hypothetical protein